MFTPHLKSYLHYVRRHVSLSFKTYLHNVTWLITTMFEDMFTHCLKTKCLPLNCHNFQPLMLFGLFENSKAWKFCSRKVEIFSNIETIKTLKHIFDVCSTNLDFAYTYAPMHKFCACFQFTASKSDLKELR